MTRGSLHALLFTLTSCFLSAYSANLKCEDIQLILSGESRCGGRCHAQDRSDDQTHCQIESIMLDAVKTFLFVPISISAILSAMQLYLAIVLLDVGLMIVTCMNLYYLQMKNGCPLHILASVAQQQETRLSNAERSIYHEFAEFLVNSVSTDRVMQKSIPQDFSEDGLRKLAVAKTVLPSTFARIVLQSLA